MGARILVVEDSAVIRRLIEVCLRAADLEIVTRTTGRAGFTRSVPSLRPRRARQASRNGWLEVLDRIRRRRHQGHPVVVSTAHAEEESRRRANEGGADAFVTKPFQPNDFRATVLSLLE